MPLLLLIFLAFAPMAKAEELFYLDRVEISFAGKNRFYSKNCSNLAEVQSILTKPLRYTVSLDCTTGRNRPIGLSIEIYPSDVIRKVEREETQSLREKRYYCF